jgi:hypothetical protein
VAGNALGMPGETGLPPLVRGYLERALPPGAEIPRQVRVSQVGEMRQEPGGRWLRFSAVEDFAVAEIAYSWRARFRIIPLVRLHVVDSYNGDEGRLEARLFGLVPVMRARGPDLAEGEAMRYLAELPWAPHAMLANSSLEWRAVDARSVEVAARVGAERAAVHLEFDDDGDVAGSFTDARPRTEGKSVVRRPWRGVFGDYGVFGGVRVPTSAEVRWELPDGEFTYWRGRIRSLEVDP